MSEPFPYSPGDGGAEPPINIMVKVNFFCFIFSTFSFILQSFEHEDCQLDLNEVSERNGM